MSRFSALLLVTAVLAVAGCKKSAPPIMDDEPRVTDFADAPDQTPAELVTGNNRFAWRLYDQLRAQPGNAIFSPFSVEAAFGMTSAGARGKTLDEMNQVFGFPQDPHSALASVFKRAIAEEGKPGGPSTKFANSVWADKGTVWLDDFRQTLLTRYGAPPKSVDIQSNPEAVRKEVNSWCAKKTNNMINELLAEGTVDRDTQMILANAVYFKGAWRDPFSAERTSDADFTMLDGKTVKVPMMRDHRHMACAPTIPGVKAKAVTMGYRNSDMAMTVVLPDANGDFAAVEKFLVDGGFAKVRESMVHPTVILGLPKFKMSVNRELTAPLKAMGLKSAFDGATADFSGMSSRKGLFIGFVVHQAAVDVNEEGTEAAAATAVGVKKESAPANDPPPPIRFIADRPFMFVLHDDRTGMIHFIGRYMGR